MESWKDIEGYEGVYQVSNEGRVRSLGNNKKRKEKTLKPQCDRLGYLTVLLYKGKPKRLLIHRLVAKAFLPNQNDYPIINHKDENKENNFVFINEDGSVDSEKSNLEWCTSKYNCNYGTRNNKMVRARENNKYFRQIAACCRGLLK